MPKVSPKLRVQKIFEQMEGPDSFILANGVEPHLDASFFYVTGFPYGLFENSFLIAERSGTITLVTSPLEEPIARAHSSEIEVFAEPDKDSMMPRLVSIAGNGLKLIGLNSSELTYGSYLQIKSTLKGSKLVDESEAFEDARLIKDESEILLIKKACDIASSTYGKIPSMLSEGVTESSVAAEMAYDMQKAGASGVSFDSIVAFGKNGSEPHYTAGDAKLRSGQFVLCDYGAKYRRYCSDITRTLVFGKASKKQKEMYELIKRALELGTQLCTPENTGEFVHSKVAALIDSTEYKGRFTHSTGHSLGLSVHDGPGLSTRYKKKLKPGMVLTVEPGIYLAGFGGVRIEDDVLVTKGKPRVLTSASRDLIEV
jgi:Xaa-Pro aminopeptidase